MISNHYPFKRLIFSFFLSLPDQYPDPKDYTNFIAKHGGSPNAYTGAINTNFYFRINSSHLEPALDRWVAIFKFSLI